MYGLRIIITVNTNSEARHNRREIKALEDWAEHVYWAC